MLVVRVLAIHNSLEPTSQEATNQEVEATNLEATNLKATSQEDMSYSSLEVTSQKAFRPPRKLATSTRLQVTTLIPGKSR